MRERRNVLIVMADQFRSDLVGANGSPACRTPSLDRLASRGVTCSRAYTTTPLCTPARGALFTGRYPHSNGLTANTQYPECPTPRLPETEYLLFQHLAAAGYRCGYAGKWHLNVGDESAEAQWRGVADFFNGGQAAALHRERLGLPPREDVGKARQRTMAGDRPPMSGVAPYPEEYHPDAGIAGQAAHLLRQYAAQGLGTPARPFSLVCSLHGPHFPIEVPEPYASLYRPEDVPYTPSFDDTFEGKPQGQRTHPWLQLAAHLSWPEWQRVIAHYWGYATFIDSLMGRVLDALEETGLAAQTVVLATADHGEMAGHHRMFDKGPYLYEDVMRVPFVWRAPAVIAPREGPETRLVSHVDVLPTLLELTGVSAIAQAPPLQGRSLVPALTSPPSPDEPGGVVFAETNAADQVNPQRDTRMILVGDIKYIYRPGDVNELYDLAADPDELCNLAGDAARQDTLRQLQQKLAAWMQQTGDRLPLPVGMA